MRFLRTWDPIDYLFFAVILAFLAPWMFKQCGGRLGDSTADVGSSGCSVRITTGSDTKDAGADR